MQCVGYENWTRLPLDVKVLQIISVTLNEITISFVHLYRKNVVISIDGVWRKEEKYELKWYKKDGQYLDLSCKSEQDFLNIQYKRCF